MYEAVDEGHANARTVHPSLLGTSTVPGLKGSCEQEAADGCEGEPGSCDVNRPSDVLIGFAPENVALTELTAFISTYFNSPLCYIHVETGEGYGTSHEAFAPIYSFYRMFQDKERPLIVADTALDSRCKDRGLLQQTVPIRFFAVFPLSSSSTNLGALILGGYQPRPDITSCGIHSLQKCAELALSVLWYAREPIRADEAIFQGYSGESTTLLSRKNKELTNHTSSGMPEQACNAARDELFHAIEQEELVLYYQPQVNLRTGKVVGFEALVRWHHPRRGLISPSEFIPFAEEEGLIVQLGWWVITKAVRQVKAWQASGLIGTDMTVSVNVSAKQLAEPRLIENIQLLLDQEQLSPRSLTLEITESILVDDARMTVQTLTKLRCLGINLDLDDFGTGYSSLSYLHRFPFTSLKLDHCFVRDLEHSPQSQAIARSVIQLARSLDMGVIAEGIETSSQVTLLRVMGCECGQGYLYARPLPVADIPVFLGG